MYATQSGGGSSEAYSPRVTDLLQCMMETIASICIHDYCTLAREYSVHMHASVSRANYMIELVMHVQLVGGVSGLFTSKYYYNHDKYCPLMILCLLYAAV